MLFVLTREKVSVVEWSGRRLTCLISEFGHEQLKVEGFDLAELNR